MLAKLVLEIIALFRAFWHTKNRGTDDFCDLFRDVRKNKRRAWNMKMNLFRVVCDCKSRGTENNSLSC